MDAKTKTDDVIIDVRTAQIPDFLYHGKLTVIMTR